MSENGGESRLHGVLPHAIKLQPPEPSWPPEVTAALNAAKQSKGKWMVAIWHADDDGTINLQWTRGANWNFDWLFRAWGQLRDLVLSAPMPALPDGSNNGQDKAVGDD